MKNIFIIIGIIGFILIFGTAGASDLELISLGELIIKLTAAFLMIAVSITGIKRHDRKIEAANRNKIQMHSHKQEEYHYSV